MTHDLALLEGKQAAAKGLTLADNPYVIGYTKLGAAKLSDKGIEWERGFASIGRRATPAEVAAAADLNVSRFRRKSNQYYSR